MSSASIQSKVEILRAKIDQRKAAEKKAFDTSVKLIEADTVDEETLIKSVMMIVRLSDGNFSFWRYDIGDLD